MFRYFFARKLNIFDGVVIASVAIQVQQSESLAWYLLFIPTALISAFVEKLLTNDTQP